MTDNDFNPVVEIQAEVQVTPTLELQAEVDMGSLASERNAEAWAVGQRGGVDVSSTDQTFHNNAKYWAEQAEQTVVGSIIDDTSTALNKTWSAHKVSEEFAETNGEVTDLKSAKAPIITESISTPADVQTFPDGADGMPVKTLTVGIEPVQEGSGDPSPENVRPITGWTGANVYKTGKNFSPIASFTEKRGTVVTFDPPLPAGTYTFSGNIARSPSGGDSGCNFRCYDVNGGYTWLAFTPNTGSPISETKTFTKPLASIYLYSYGTSYSDSGNYTVTATNFQIELGSTSSAFEAYAGETIEYTFPSEAGTVYGGNLTIHQDGSGELVVDRALVDLGTLNYTKYDVTEGALFRGVISNAATVTNSGTVPDFICSSYPVVATGLRTNKTVSQAVNYPAVDIVDNDYSDASTFKTAMSGVQLVYELATPVTYQLTNQQVIQLLSFNNIWADTGKINAVDYPADTKLYIDKKFTELQALVLEN